MLKPLLLKGLRLPSTSSLARFYLLLLSLIAPISVAYANDGIPELSQTPLLLMNLSDEAIPIILVVRSENCGYCKRLEDEQLLPIQRKLDRQAKQTVIIRAITLEDRTTFFDFAGESTRASKLSRHYDARITPTVLFLNADGEEIAKRLVGYNNDDYYGYYFEQALKMAEKKLNSERLLSQASTENLAN